MFAALLYPVSELRFFGLKKFIDISMYFFTIDVELIHV